MLTTHPFHRPPALEAAQGEESPAADDRFHEECGVFGIIGQADASNFAALGLHALQHRGQEAAGIVSFDGTAFHAHHGLGQVGDHFSNEAVIARLRGQSAIGHVRYATSGVGASRLIQPLFVELQCGGFALAHNGNLTNAVTLREALIRRGSLFQSSTDTEVIVHLMASVADGDAVERLVTALSGVEGAFSLVALFADGIMAARDAHGVRPLVLGRRGAARVVASETCALDIIGADLERDVRPGELMILHADGRVESRFPFAPKPSRFCVFEYIYFSRPDSTVEGRSVYEVRRRIGRELAREAPAEVDMVVAVPDSGVAAAIGYAEGSGLPFELGIIRSHYRGRTFIEPSQNIRHLGVKLKHGVNRALIRDRRVVLVDDSIVRGTTSQKIVEMVRAAGAREVHMRISSPPTMSPCFYGIDTPKSEELLAHRMSSQLAMCRHIGADSLEFLSIDGLYRATGEAGRDPRRPQYCDACFTGDYPIALCDVEQGKVERPGATTWLRGTEAEAVGGGAEAAGAPAAGTERR